MKYTSKSKLKYVLVKNDEESKPFKTIYDIYKASDTYSGVHYAKGGLTDAKYISKRNSIVVDDNGKIVSDKLNGVWLKETAKPVGSIEGTEAMELKTAADWENYLKGGSGSQEVELTPNVIRKGMYGWKGKTYSKGQINGYDWDITTIKVSSGKLVSSIQGGSRSKGDGFESFQFTMFQDPSANLIVTSPKVVNEKRVREQHEQAVEEFKRMVREGRLPEKKYEKGGGIGSVKIIKDEVRPFADQPERVVHIVEGMYGDYWFKANTSNSYLLGYGSDGINKKSVYRIDVWRGGNPVGRDKSTKGGHVSEDYIAGYWNKWDYRPKTKKEKEVVSAIVNYLDTYVANSKQEMGKIKFAEGGEIVVKSGSNGNLQEVFRREKNQRNELLANEIFDDEKSKGNSVFLMVDGELYDSHTASGDEDSYSKGGLVEEIKQFEKYNYPKPKTKGDKVRAIFKHFSKKGYSNEQINNALATMKYAKGGTFGAGNFAEGGKLENISPILKPKIEAIEKILPKALGESSLTIEFAFQTNTGYAFNMISRTDLPVNRATPKLKKIGVEVERTGEKGRRLITIPRGVFDKMTAIYADGGLIEDMLRQRDLTDMQIRTQLLRELGLERASRYMSRDNDREHGVSAMSLLMSAVSKGWLSVDEMDINMFYAASSAADETAELEEMGSSDMNFILKGMLENAGIEMGYEGNRIVRKYSNPEEVNIKDKTHRNGK